MPGGGLTRIRGEEVTPGSGQSEGGHEENGVQEGGCLVLQFCFISKKCVHCCRQY